MAYNLGVNHQVLYGQDLIPDFEMPSILKISGFSGFENVKLLESKDFYYSSFKLDGYDYLLYSDQANSNYPIASVFSRDVAELPFICSAAQYEHTNHIKWNLKPEVFEKTNIDPNKLGETNKSNEVSRISRTYNFDHKFLYSDCYCRVHIIYSPTSLTLVQNNFPRELLQKPLSKEFGKEETRIKVVEYLKTNSLKSKFLVSYLRACVVAIRASIKFKSDIVFIFKPFSIYGPLKIVDSLFFNKQNSSVVSRELNLNYDLGLSSLYKDQLVQVIQNQCFPDSDTLITTSKITFSHKYQYNSTLTPEYFEKTMQTVNMISFNSLCMATGKEKHEKMEEVLKKILERDSGREVKINAYHDFIDKTKYLMKKSIFLINKSKKCSIPILESKKNKAVYFYPLLRHGDISAVVAEIDEFVKCIEQIYFLLPNFDFEKQQNSLLNLVSSFFTKFGYTINAKVTKSSIHCSTYESSSSVNPLSLATSLLNVFNPVYSTMEQNV